MWILGEGGLGGAEGGEAAVGMECMRDGIKRKTTCVLED